MLENMETPPEPSTPERRHISYTDFAEGLGAALLLAAARNDSYEQTYLKYLTIPAFIVGAGILVRDILRRR